MYRSTSCRENPAEPPNGLVRSLIPTWNEVVAVARATRKSVIVNDPSGNVGVPPLVAVGRAKLPGPAPPSAGPVAFSTTVPGVAREVTSNPAALVPPPAAVAVTATWLWSPAVTATVAVNAPVGPAVTVDVAAVSFDI